jgi:hypothetical protein
MRFEVADINSGLASESPGTSQLAQKYTHHCPEPVELDSRILWIIRLPIDPFFASQSWPTPLAYRHSAVAFQRLHSHTPGVKPQSLDALHVQW